jgi:hypothetical protein
MFFPFSVKQTIRIDTESPISSGPYVLNHIAGYMDDYRMSQTKKTDNELFYMRTDLFKTYERKDLLRNVSFRVEFPGNEMKITLESETILWFMTGALVGLVLFVVAHGLALPVKIAIMCIFWMSGWLLKLVLLHIIKKELQPILQKI